MYCSQVVAGVCRLLIAWVCVQASVSPATSHSSNLWLVRSWGDHPTSCASSWQHTVDTVSLTTCARHNPFQWWAGDHTTTFCHPSSFLLLWYFTSRSLPIHSHSISLSSSSLSLFLPLLSPSYLTLQLFTHSSHSLSLSSLPGSGARILYQGSYCCREHDSDRRGRRAGEGYKFGLLMLLLSHSPFFLSLLWPSCLSRLPSSSPFPSSLPSSSLTSLSLSSSPYRCWMRWGPQALRKRAPLSLVVWLLTWLSSSERYPLVGREGMSSCSWHFACKK